MPIQSSVLQLLLMMNTTRIFGTKPVPTLGVSLGIERVFAIMEQLQKDRNELWCAKLKSEFLESTRFDKLIGRAKDLKIPWMVLVGDRELEIGIVKIKNLETNPEGSVTGQALSLLSNDYEFKFSLDY
uniref:Anticodon-binding domain-containing protein n=1 Tax=Populus trichocarpa TaxID=3694 RepID=B9MWJ9_POPTR